MQACSFGAELFVVHTTVWKILLSQGPAVLDFRSQTHLRFTWHLEKNVSASSYEGEIRG